MAYCDWDAVSDVTRAYHDEEWGVPLFDDVRQFEFLSLEVMQCGLSWTLVMAKREVLRRCFDGFDYGKVALYTEDDVERILETEGMIRSRRKIEAIIGNACAFEEIRAEYGTFSDYLWGFSDGKMITYTGHAEGNIPASNGLSKKISKDLKKRGFKYLGPVVMYSHLQACGIVNDHDNDCPRRHQVSSGIEVVELGPDDERGVKCYR